MVGLDLDVAKALSTFFPEMFIKSIMHQEINIDNLPYKISKKSFLFQDSRAQTFVGQRYFNHLHF